jgi:hypothetical protein
MALVVAFVLAVVFACWVKWSGEERGRKAPRPPRPPAPAPIRPAKWKLWTTGALLFALFVALRLAAG